MDSHFEIAAVSKACWEPKKLFYDSNLSQCLFPLNGDNLETRFMFIIRNIIVTIIEFETYQQHFIEDCH